MTRGTESKCSSMEVNGPIQVRQDTPLLESVYETDGKIVERLASIRTTSGMERKCSSIEVNGFIQVRQDTPLVESLSKTQGKAVERQGSI